MMYHHLLGIMALLSFCCDIIYNQNLFISDQETELQYHVLPKKICSDKLILEHA